MTEIEKDLYIKMDPSAADRITNNLLDNAVKYTEPEGRISVSLSAEDLSLVLKVKDTGIGISPEQQANIFKPYFQISHKKRNVQGIGMGLNIVRKIIDETGGEISVSSQEGEGTEFTVRFKQHVPKENEDIQTDFEVSEPGAPVTKMDLKPELIIRGRHNILIEEFETSSTR